MLTVDRFRVKLRDMKFPFVLVFSFLHLAALGQYTLVWADEFDSADLNLSKWDYDLGQGSWGWGNNELQYYTNNSSNVMLDNGYLRISANEEQVGSANYTSGRIKSKDLFDFQYGKVEARIQVPVGQGLWPAFWMLGANIDDVNWPQCGEIDVMEHINTETVIHGAHHYNNNGHQYSGGSVVCDANEFNVYAIEWSPLSIKWMLNGVMFYEADISSSAVSKEEFHEPFFLLINLAVGGNWPGSPNASTQFPAVMLVDYVRVYQDDIGCTDPAADNYNPNATIDDGSCSYSSTTLSVTTTVCDGGAEVRMTGPWWSWAPNGGPVASPNGDGTWTFTFDPAPTADMEYLLVIDGVLENLIQDMVDGGSCAPVTDYWSYANRLWLTGSGDVTNVYGTCGECGTNANPGCTDSTANNYDPSAPSDNGSCMYDVNLTVDMNCSGLTPGTVAATGPSDGWSCGTYALSDVDGDGVWEGTFSLAEGSFEYIYCTDSWAQQETAGLLSEMQNAGTCAPVTDYNQYANRLITVGAMTTFDTWGTCSDCAPVGCAEDVDNDGVVTVSDVLAILSEFGCSVGCQHDLNMDGNVGVADVLDVLAAFGDAC